MRTHIPIPRPEKRKKIVSRLHRGGRIKPVSATKAKLQKIYSALRKTFLEAHPICQHWLKENGWREIPLPSGTHYFQINEFTNGYPPQALSYVWGAKWAEDVHHMKGRGKYYLDTSTWMAVSRQAHEKIHADPKTSYEKGYMLPRN